MSVLCLKKFCEQNLRGLLVNNLFEIDCSGKIINTVESKSKPIRVDQMIVGHIVKVYISLD